MENNHKVLGEIAKQLAIDYFSISNIDPKVANSKLVNAEIFRPPYDKELDISYPCNVRNIVVLGAGATFDAYKQIPLAKKAVEILEKELEIADLHGRTYIGEKIKEIENHMKEVYKLDPEDFESKLSLFKSFVREEDILKQLQNLYNKKTYPCLLYEILAHLFKHRFIDAIINFNFDELLDQALEEELSHEDYHNIYSDGQCMSFNDILISGRMKLPLYIKPHGTISHKSSLKFTKDHYFGLSEDMRDLLEGLINGKRGTDESSYIKRVNLIVIGTSLKSIEFNKILADKLPEGSAIYFFSTEKPKFERKTNADELFYERFQKSFINEEGIERFYQIESNGPNNQLGKAFELLYKKFLRKKIFNPLYEPKDIYRHKIITTILYNQGTGKRLFDTLNDREASRKEKDQKYLEIRLYLEFLISLVKAKGKITLRELMQERFGYYFDKYYSIASKSANFLTIKRIINFYNIKDQFKAPDQRIVLENRKNGAFISHLFNSFCNLGNETAYNELSECIGNGAQKKKAILAWLQKLFEHDSLSISPRFRDRTFLTFPEASEQNIITTKLRLVTSFLSVDDWDLLLATSNKGKLLINLLVAEKRARESSNPIKTDYSKKTICVFLEDDIYKDELQKYIGNKRLLHDKIFIKKNTGDRSNLLLFLKRNKDDQDNPWEFKRGIVCYRINDSFKVFPYFVKDNSHYKILRREFLNDYSKEVLGEELKRKQSLDLLKQIASEYDKKQKLRDDHL